MEINENNIKVVEQAIAVYLDAEAPKNGLYSLNYSQLFNRIKYQIEYLLRTNHDRLMQGLYRIDVPEEKVKEAFKAGSLTEIAEALAVLIINREAQKVSLREKYQGRN